MTNLSTLVSLVSEQRMQNVIPLFHRTLHYDQVVLVASSDNGGTNPRFAKIAKDLESALRERAHWVLWDRSVDPMEPSQTLDVCLDIIRAFGGSEATAINFTGGTKPMSIGAYQAGLNSGCEMLYVDTQKEQIFRYRQGIPRAESFDLERITLAQILAAHGKPVNENWTMTKQPSAVERKITEEIFARRSYMLQQAIVMQGLLRPIVFDINQQKHINNDALLNSRELVELLQIYGEAQRDDPWLKISNRMCRYFDGNWLEQYVTLALEKDGRFDDVAGNVQLAGVENELDVACTLNGKLAIVECKSGKMEGGEGAIVMNRLRALKDSIAGTFGRTILVTCYDTSRLSNRFLDRAREYVSHVVGLADLDKVECVIYDEIVTKRR